MRKVSLSIVCIIYSLICSAQSIDERIANAMNASDWFALDSIYNAAPKDSINPFLEVFSRGLIGNRLNRPDISIPAFEDLLNNYSTGLDLSNLLNSAVMLSMDYSKTGDNAKAATVLTSVLDATRQYLDSAAIDGLQLYIDRYSAFAPYQPYSISIEGPRGLVPFRITPVGKPEKGSVLMTLDSSSINGLDADIVFDTGAGVNIISDSLARKFGLIPLEAYNNVMGIGKQRTQYAIARELKLGNITVRDVPFVIVDFKVDNEEADKYMDCLNIVVGSELMLRLNNLTLDFIKREITVAKNTPQKSQTAPNMCFSPSMNLITRGSAHDNPMWICIDTGDSSFGSLNGEFLERNKDYVLTHARPDTVRMAGIGGVHISECYTLPDLSISLGGHTVTVPEITVNTGTNPLSASYECNLGLKSLMQFGRIQFNMVDFTITTYPVEISECLPTPHKLRPFKYAGNNKTSFLQTLGLVTLSVANGIFNTNAPDAPDL